MLRGKTIVLAVSGSIAAYKIANLARMCKKLGADVQVLMTENATNFINPITFETLTGNKCLIDTFDRNFQYSVEHVALAKRASVVLIAPASANVIGKLANGIADDMLTTTVMACPCKKIISPAMNHNMLHNPIVQENISKLAYYGYEIVVPDSGMLANGDYGDGRMPDEKVLLNYIIKECAFEKDMIGEKVLVTAGATREPLDPVRFITNHSTGKMGYALAENAMLRGAEVTLVTAHAEITPPPFVKVLRVSTAQEMYDTVTSEFDNCTITVKAAAVADYKPVSVADNKIKKSDGNLTVEFARNPDILAELGKKKKDQFLCGFSMETENLVENSRKKLQKKNLDMIVANNLKTEGAGFGTDTNVVTMITNNSVKELELMSKQDVAKAIFDEILKLKKKDK